MLRGLSINALESVDDELTPAPHSYTAPQAILLKLRNKNLEPSLDLRSSQSHTDREDLWGFILLKNVLRIFMYQDMSFKNFQFIVGHYK